MDNGRRGWRQNGDKEFPPKQPFNSDVFQMPVRHSLNVHHQTKTQVGFPWPFKFYTISTGEEIGGHAHMCNWASVCVEHCTVHYLYMPLHVPAALTFVFREVFH